MGNLLQDARFAFRMMAKSRMTTAILLITLALGIGANTAVFSLINGLVLRSLPVNHPEQLFFFGNDQWYGSHSGNLPSGSISFFSYRFFQQLRERKSSGIEGLTAMASPQPGLRVAIPSSSEQPRRFQGSLVDGNFFHLLGVNAILGRTLVAEDDLPDKPVPVTVISYRYWNERLGRDPSAPGKTLLINGASYTIVGVMPPEFFGVKLNMQPPDFWFPLNQQSALMERTNWLKADDVYWLDVFARIRPATNVRATATVLTAQVQQMMSALKGDKISPEDARRIRESYVELVAGSGGISGLRDRFSPRLRVLAVLVILVLIITCLNTANLLLSRATARQREMGVRLAMGAKRGRLIRQLLTESVLLAAIGGLAGFALAAWGTRLASTLVFGIAPGGFSFRPDLRVLAFSFGVSLLSGIIFGLAPAFRTTKINLNGVLKDQFLNGSSAGAKVTPAKLLVSSQVVVSLAMLMAAGLFTGSLRNLEYQDLGFAPEQVLTCRLDLAAAGYHKDNLPQLYTRLIDRVSALPGVRSAALADSGMLTGSTNTSNISIENYPQKRDENMNIQHRHVTWNYVQTNGMTLLQGRDISSDDQDASPHVAVVNQAFVDRYFPGQSPIGHHFRLGAPFQPPGMTIIGVVGNSKYNTLDEKPVPLAFIPLLQEPFSNQSDAPKNNRPYVYGNELNLRVAGDPSALAESLRRAIGEVDNKIAVSNISSLAQRVNDSAHDARTIAQLAGFFGVLGLILAAIGLYGVMAYNVSRRTREIGVRMAIGAEAHDVLRMVLRESLLIVAIGILAGIPAAMGMGRLISSQLYGLSPRDPITLAIAAVLLLIVCVLASYLPARRAARIDPMVALRHE
jgi:predicted permease